jgi:uncharacterized membrane protein
MGGAHSRRRAEPDEQTPGPGFGHGHSHSHDAVELEVSPGPRLALVAGLLLAAIATVVGLLMLWPHASDAPPAVPFLKAGATQYDAEVVSVNDPCPSRSDDQSIEQPRMPPHCNELTFTVLAGPDAGKQLTIQAPPLVSRAGLVAGDAVTVVRQPPEGGAPASYAFFRIDRNLPIGLMAGALVLVVALVARLRGLLALVGLVIAGLVIGKFMLPALLAGESGVGVALAGSAAIMFVVLYLTHGVSLRTSAALAGTLVGIAITAGLGTWAVSSARLSGVADDYGSQLLTFDDSLNFRGLLTCAVIVAGLGVLNDVTITQASAVWELRAASPTMSPAALFAAGMRIGRDHIASTIYTIVFAYAGTAMALLLLLSLYHRPLLELIGDEGIAEEVVRTLSSAIGLVLAVPVTTAIAVLATARTE